MHNSPVISVIMPVYNCELYVGDAVESILNQTFTDFELIIIDDKSTDLTVRVIKKYTDKRIRLIQKPNNTGYTDSLNYAISIARGEYIARMDGDDISLSERFKIQIDFLKANKDVLLCGTGIKIINSERKLNHPLSHEEIKTKLCFANSIYHPTVVIRKEVFNIYKYDKNFEPAEDYDLWTKLVFRGKLMNINQTLLHYREHDSQVSSLRKEIQLKSATLAKLRMFQVLFKDEIIDFEMFEEAFNYNSLSKIKNLSATINFFKKAKKNNRKFKIYDKYIFELNLEKSKIKFLKDYFRSNKLSINDVKSYLINLSFRDFIKLLNVKKRLKSKFLSL